MNLKKKLVLFASGSGTNVENISKYFEQDKRVSIAAVFTNRPQAQVLERIKPFGIKGIPFTREQFETGWVLEQVQQLQPDLIVLAGFLWKIPAAFVATFPLQIINIHPALLPKYGGKGMYGAAVHQAVKTNREKESGITIHYVNEKYDEGAIIFQATTAIHPGDTPSTIADKVHALEYQHFPVVLEQLLFPTHQNV